MDHCVHSSVYLQKHQEDLEEIVTYIETVRGFEKEGGVGGFMTSSFEK